MRDFDPTASEYISSGYIENSRPGGRLYDFGAITGPLLGSIAAPIIGGIIGSDSAGDATDAASQSASDTNALNKYIYDKSVAHQWVVINQHGMQSLFVRTMNIIII